jgi:hypothetical protein
MSERRYEPGVSAPAPITREVEAEILGHCFGPIAVGVPSKRNPLGLWHVAYPQTPSQKSAQLKTPYAMPGDKWLNFPRISQGYTTNNEVDYFASGIYGGMIASAERLDYFRENKHLLRHLITSMGTVGYGLSIMFSMQREIAQQYALHNQAVHSTEELRTVLFSSFDVVKSGLMCVRGSDGVRIERELGLVQVTGIPLNTPESGASMTLEPGGKCPLPVISLPVKAGERALCGAMYVTDDAGVSLAQTTWNRVTQVGMSIPALFPKLLKATGTKR